MNRRLADSVIDSLLALGVREWCACAGARNSPLFVALLERSEIRVLRFFEERSAAFFALGRIQTTGRPVAVLTTSGTAAAELLPAVIEAHYSRLPLFAVTADRPRRYRGTGAPQSIEQVGIFGGYVATSLDVAPGEELPRIAIASDRPSHFNVCFEEPLLGDAPGTAPAAFHSQSPVVDESASLERFREFLDRCRQPLVVVGPLAENRRVAVGELVRSLRAPVLAETASGLRGACGDFELRAGERLALAFFREGGENAPDGVLRLGGVPTCRLWRDLESRLSALPVLSLSDQPFAGLSRGECFPFGRVIDQCPRAGWTPERLAIWVTRDYAQATLVDNLLLDFPRSEPGMVRALSRLVPKDSALYLGNSLPIREWDLAASRDLALGPVGVNRGANGIDGQLSTFLGFCREGTSNWALLGDLTTLYDLSAPWILPQLPELRFVLAVMNNGGGQILSRMFSRPEFQNRHTTGFGSWAQMWGLDYESWTEVPARYQATGAHVLELLPDEEQTTSFWRGFDRLW